MKYYYVRLLDGESAIKASRMLESNSGSIQFWVDTSEEDETAHMGRTYSHTLITMYSNDYWLSVNEIDEKEFNEAMKDESEGGVH